MTELPRSRLGAYVLPGAAPDPAAGLEQARATERMGLAALWIGERYDTKDLAALAGAISQVTHRVQVGAALHDVPWQRSHAFLAGNDAAPGLTTDLRHMAEWYHWATDGRSFPVADAALAYAIEHADGTTTSSPVLAWGDARPGNIIFDPGRCVSAALIDWEVVAIAPPEADVAHWLVFDDFATSATGVERLPGYASREEILSRYEAVSGRRLGDVGYFEIVQCLFLATTLIRQADAHVRRGELAADTRMGHANPVTQMLARRLGLPVPELSEDYLRHRGGPRGQAVPAQHAGDAAEPTSKAGR